MPYEQSLLYNISRTQVLASPMKAIWDAMSIGVAVVDAEGICEYMNPIQRQVDGFSKSRVEGAHITTLYIPNNFDCIPTIECLQTGKPILHKIYWYKTTGNYTASTVTDFLPLFDKGKKDGVLAFTIWRNNDKAIQKPSRKRNSPCVTGPQHLYSFDDLAGSDEELARVIEEARKTASASSPVMIWGESGTGKEVFAQAIHGASRRKNGRFVPVNCAAIPENLLEGILFGTTRGAYTDAPDRPGLFEEANGGTLLLDELNSMPLSLQAKLLRVLQEKKVRRLGAHTEIPVDVRVISILNQPPLDAVAKGILRRDLYYRLAVVGLSVPPLRKRKGDIPLLAKKLLEDFTAGADTEVRLSDEVLDMFTAYEWPGNVRELAHVLEGCLVLSGNTPLITPEYLPGQFREACREREFCPQEQAGPRPEPGLYFDYRNIRRSETIPLKACMTEYESRCIVNVLRVTGGNVAKAARILDMTAAGLRYRIKTLNIQDDSY